MSFWWNPLYFLFIAPAVLLMIWAQMRVHSAFRRGMQVPAELSGAAAARYILDQAGLHDVEVEQTHGMLSDHYDPLRRVLRLSRDVYHNRTAAAVGIAAHEAGHALQHAEKYAPLVVRNIAVPAAQFGPITFVVLMILGFLMQDPALILLGIAAYGGLVFFQLVNLPVEFDASSRAKRILAEYGIVDGEGAAAVSDVLNAAGWTYVAATLESLLTMAYYLFIFFGQDRD